MPSLESMGVIDHSGGHSHLSLFTLNTFGELTSNDVVINLRDRQMPTASH